MGDGLSSDVQHGELRSTLFSSSGRCRSSSLAPFCDRVRAVLDPERFAHVIRVTQFADAIGRANGFASSDLAATCLAAILHDVARDLPSERLMEIAPPENDMERRHPLALHGRAGAVIAREWGVTDERVVEAIEGHVFGVRPGDRVGMAVYVADVAEPGRGVNADIRELALHDLDRAYRCAVDAKVRYLRRCGKDVHPRTLEVHEAITRAR